MEYCRLWQKLIFYYYADHYVNSRDLVNDLYKVRLWMSAVNSASFSTNAISHWWLSNLAPSSLAGSLTLTSKAPTPWRTAPGLDCRV